MFTEAQIKAIMLAFEAALRGVADTTPAVPPAPPPAPPPVAAFALVAPASGPGSVTSDARIYSDASHQTYWFRGVLCKAGTFDQPVSAAAPLPAPAPAPIPAPAPAPTPAPAPPVAVPAVPTIATVAGPRIGSGPYGQPLHARIDPILPPGSPDTVTLPVTGHVLSKPICGVDARGNWDGTGEGFLGYYLRTSLQVGSTVQEGVNTQGSMIVACPPARAPLSGVAAWPQQSDEARNPQAYNPVDPRKAAQDAADWAAVNARLAEQRQPAAPAPVVDQAPPAVVEG
jgi:hypothetical protein